MKLSLKEHILRSREAVFANKAKGNRHAEILTGLYTNLNRFIEEVMQNAEDAYTRKLNVDEVGTIKFKLFADRVEIFHNGKDFDEDDLMSVTTFANTTKDKKNEINLIGKFGIGFKSVFSITDSPEIHSGKYHYRIEDYEVLEDVFPSTAEIGFGTKIILPFKKENIKEIYDSVKSGLLQINANNLLFLKKIRNIEIVFEKGVERKIECITENLKSNIEIKKFFFSDQTKNNNEEYLIISDHTKAGIEINFAFKLEYWEGKKRIVPCNNPSVFVYFPTLHSTALKFIINAGFTTTPTREFVPFDKYKSPENLKILKEAVEFYKTVLVKIKDTGFFDNTFLEVLPIENPENFLFNNRENEIYRTFYDATLEVLKTKKIIPVIGKRYCCASEIAFSLSDKITQLLKKNDLELLFNRSEWFEINANTSNSITISPYLESKLNIKKVDEESFAFRIAVNPSFFNDKNEKWFVSFYEFLLENRNLWDKEHRFNYYSLRNKPIVLADSGAVITAFDDNDLPIVYLVKGRAQQHNIVKKSLLKNENVQQFFNELGLSEPDIYAEVVDSILPKYKTNDNHSFAEYSKDLLKVLFVYFNDSVVRKNEMMSFLIDSYFIHTSSGNYQKPQFVYLRNKNLLDYFEGNENTQFVSERTIKFLNINSFTCEVIEDFFKDCGIKKFPEINVNKNEVFISGFEHFLKNPSLKRTKAFLRLLISYPLENFSPEVTGYLEKKKWIFLKSNKIVSPEEIELVKLISRAGFSEPEALKLKSLLRFKTGKINQLTEKQLKLLGILDRIDISEEEIDQYLNHPKNFNASTEIIDYSSHESEFLQKNSGNIDLNIISNLQNILSFGFNNDIISLFKKTIRDSIYAELANLRNIEILCDNIPEELLCDIVVRKDNGLEMLVYIAEKNGFGSTMEINIDKWAEIEKYSKTELAERTFIYLVSSKSNKITKFRNPALLLSAKRLHKKSIILFFS